MKSLYLFCCLTILSLASCKYGQECTETIKCNPTTYFKFALYNYSKEEADTVIIRYYSATNTFDKPPADSIVCTFSNQRIITQKVADSTVSYGLRFAIVRQEQTGHSNLEIVVPRSNRTYRITDMTDDGNRSHRATYICGKEPTPQCYLEVVSLKVDGVLYTNPKADGSPHSEIALKK